VHAPYCHLWPAPLYNIFPHYLQTDMIFERKKKKTLLNTKFVFWFCLQFFLSETFLIIRRNERDMIKKLYWSSFELAVIIVRF